MTIKIDSDPRLQTANAVVGSVRASGNQPNAGSVVSPTAQSENTNATKATQTVNSGLKAGGDNTNANPLSKEAQEEKKRLEEEKLQGVVTDLNSSIQGVQRNLAFSVDDNSGEIVISVTDKQSGEIVRQIPSEEALELAKKLHELSQAGGSKDTGSAEGLLVKTSA